MEKGLTFSENPAISIFCVYAGFAHNKDIIKAWIDFL